MGKVRVGSHIRSGRPVKAYSQNRRSAVGGGAGLLVAVVVGVAWLNFGSLSSLTQLGQGRVETMPASVERIVDGDTIVVRDRNGEDLGRVRILGMDAPELSLNGRPAMCGATAAQEELARLLEGQNVQLVTDPRQPDRDDYDRLLRYVEVGSVDVTESLIRSGHAPATSRAQTHTRHETYAAAESDAQEHERGLWGTCL